MLRYFGRRLLEIIPLAIVVSLVCFALMQATPGGPAAMLSQNPMVKPEDIARIRANFGIDQPVMVQYFMWLKRVVLHGDFGSSYVTGEPVLHMIGRRLPATLELMGSAFLLAFLLGMTGGIISALKRFTKIDSFLSIMAVVAISIPVFWLGLMAMMLFTVKWRLLPSAGMFSLGVPFSTTDHLMHLILPSLVLSLLFMASWSRYMRASLSEVLAMDYICVAKAKGASRTSVVFKHAIRNASIPVLTIIALNLPALFTGSIIVETLFSWPGMGRLFYEGLLRQDYTRLMGIIFIASILIAFLNLLADLAYGVLDPRVRYAR
ncbi:MAG: ABC transporter permease subunit [Candidatus Latescibacteria bacterium]|nr:ABC transporter permease subunit [Candidatus Latescibacterota bacterium]NIO27263.1 ABC transporter permease subunit [Candidatus Latescibacterota bacterium]NIO54787.1 ABC transporter permease subunit [Candidatus Latescibacterota bacterium]NIT00870.1 ABC transporter permease subunit [Candidatus Latescibacterota bacterium]NIT37793.1 ABC transporter permease subunit [Candidatus Latescibacterota bacterium]